MVPEWEPLAVRLAAQLLAQPWVVPSAQPWGPPSELWPEQRLDTRPVKRSIRQDSRVLIRLVPEWEPLAVRLAAQLLAQPWAVPSAQSRGPPSEEWPEQRLDTRPVKRSIRYFKNRPLLARSPYSDYETAYHVGNLMSSKPVHAIAGRTLRHWTIDSRDFVGKSQQPAPALPYLEQPDGGQFHLLASKLARVKTELAHRVS